MHEVYVRLRYTCFQEEEEEEEEEEERFTTDTGVSPHRSPPPKGGETGCGTARRNLLETAVNGAASS